MNYILNSLPNSLLIAALKEEGSVILWDEETVRSFLNRHGFVSAVGHDSTAKLLSARLGQKVESNRIQIQPEKSDRLVCALFQTPRRLGEGEMYTEEEILNMDISYILVTFRKEIF